MAKKEQIIEEKCEKKWHHHHGGTSGAVYGLGFIGAAIFYIQHSDTFWAGALGILKALIWPAFLVHKALEFFK